MAQMNREWSIDLKQFRSASDANLAGGRIRCDADGAVYVVDGGDRSVMKFDDRGDLCMKISTDDVPIGFYQPRDIAIDDEGRFFVTDFGTEDAHARIDTFDARGKWRACFIPDTRPDSIVVDSTGHLYVHAPLQEFRIIKYNRGGDRVGAFGRRASRRTEGVTGERQDVQGGEDTARLAIDRHDHIYFSPQWTYDIAVYNSKGKPVRRLKRRVQEEAIVAELGSRGERMGWTVVVGDIATAPTRDEIYVLKPSDSRGRTEVDLWHDGTLRKSLCLDERASVIACDRRGLYLLYASFAEDTMRLVRYRM